MYIYADSHGNELSMGKQRRKDAEYNASWDMFKNKNNDKYNLHDINSVRNFEKAQDKHSDFNNAVNDARQFAANKRFGANGMPSKISEIMEKHADENLEKLYKKYLK